MVFALSMVIFMTMTVLVCWQDRRYLHVAAMGPDRSGAVRESEPCLLGTAQRKYSPCCRAHRDDPRWCCLLPSVRTSPDSPVEAGLTPLGPRCLTSLSEQGRLFKDQLRPHT